jgi:hypothetical protein
MEELKKLPINPRTNQNQLLKEARDFLLPRLMSGNIKVKV